MQGMLHALRTATEFLLDTGLNTSNVAIPEYFSHEQQSLLTSAFEAEGLQRSRPSFSTAGGAASRANGVSLCDPESCDYRQTKPQIFLTVDYSRSSLTLVSWVEEYTVSEHFNILHDVDLGADALAHGTESEQEEYWGDVKQFIEKIAQVSDSLPEDYESITPKVISQVVLLGDRVLNRRLLSILRDALGPHLVSTALSNDEQGPAPPFVDPVFAAARGVAAGSREMIVHGRWDCEAPGYCDEPRTMGHSEL